MFIPLTWMIGDCHFKICGHMNLWKGKPVSPITYLRCNVCVCVCVCVCMFTFNFATVQRRSRKVRELSETLTHALHGKENFILPAYRHKHICVCMCVCVYIYIYIYIYTHTHTCTYICVCVCVCARICVHVYICVYVCIHVHVCIFLFFASWDYQVL
jgi:hypothetical protein